MEPESSLQAARSAFERRAWKEVCSAYSTASQAGALPLDDSERQAIAAHLVGLEDESREALTGGHREALRRDDAKRAARFAFWMAHSMIFTGEFGQARGWLGRARTLLAELGVDCAEWGYLMIPTGVEQLLIARDPGAACRTFTEALAIARRFADPDLMVMSGHGRGRALIRLGMADEGMAVLDEVMVTATSVEVSPMIIGHLYCGVLEACQEVFDFRRAREWTAVLTRWCEGQPDLVPYRGPCMVHRVELMRLRGDWEDALEEARRACEWLSLPDSPEGPGDAFYQLGELYRLRGDFTAAEAAYRRANVLGRTPEPGLALVWLASGRTDAAKNAIRRALSETTDDRAKRAELLAGYVEILLTSKDLEAARTAARELVDLAATVDALPFEALASRTHGAVLIVDGDPGAALAPLRRAWTAWKQLEAPYEAARTRVLIAAAYRALGDEESAAMELDAARVVLEQLGAMYDLAQLPTGAPSIAERSAAGLTPRELEVLRLVAAGETNKAIAAALVVSEHTVARHVQNMLTKLGFSSRTGLATFAVERGFLDHRSSQD